MYDCSAQHALAAHMFTGKERNTESGFDNFGKRYDASSLGRFMTLDAFHNDSHVGPKGQTQVSGEEVDRQL